MTFNDYLERLKRVLTVEFGNIDFNDIQIMNKVEELAYILVARLNNPPQKPVKPRPPQVEWREGDWRLE